MGKMGMAREQLSGELACWDAEHELELNCMLCGASRPYGPQNHALYTSKLGTTSKPWVSSYSGHYSIPIDPVNRYFVFRVLLTP